MILMKRKMVMVEGWLVMDLVEVRLPLDLVKLRTTMATVMETRAATGMARMGRATVNASISAKERFREADPVRGHLLVGF